jgi:hypothetical protein
MASPSVLKPSTGSSSAELRIVRADQVKGVWWVFRPMIACALDAATVAERANGWDLPTIQARLIDGSMQMWTAGTPYDGVKAVAITEIVETEDGRIAGIPVVAGDDMTAWLDYVDTIETWAKINQCDWLQGQGRKGWARILKRYGWDIVTTRGDGVMQIRKAL